MPINWNDQATEDMEDRNWACLSDACSTVLIVDINNRFQNKHIIGLTVDSYDCVLVEQKITQ